MSFNNFSSSVKLNNIKAYGGVNTTSNDAFKRQVYSDIEEIDYGSYEEVDYNSINLQAGIENAIEKRNEKEWYEYVGDGLEWYIDKKIQGYCSLANTAMGFVEGVLEFGEDIVDAGAWIGTILTAKGPILADIGTGILTGDWDFSNTGAHFNKTASFVREEWVDTAFDYLYEEGPLKYVEDGAGKAFKRDGGFVYGISESAGKYAATIAVSTVIPGGPVLAKGLAFGVTKFGDAIEDGVQKVTTNEDGSAKEASVLDFARETLVAGAKGTVEGTVMAGATKLSGMGMVKSSIGLKAIKPMANELIGVVNGEEFNVNEVLVDTAAVVVSEMVALKLKPYNPKVKFETNSSAPAATSQSIKSAGGFTSSNNDTKVFANSLKKAVAEGINKGIEKSEKETVKKGIDSLVSIFN